MMFERNSIPDILSDVVAATLPFIAIGMLGDKVILYISVVVGVIAVLALILSLLLKWKSLNNNPLLLPQDLSLPYAFALSSTILESKGIDASAGFWIALILTVLIVSTAMINGKTKK